MFRIFFCFFIIVCCICSCKNHSKAKEIEVIKETPAIGELIGVYNADEHTSKSVNGYTEKITSFFKLSKDGVLEFSQIPISTLDFAEYFKNNHTLISGNGKWDVSNQSGFVELNFEMNINDSTIGNVSFTLGRRSKKYAFSSFVGDPNKNVSVTFVQQ